MSVLMAKPVLIGLHLVFAIVGIDGLLWLLSELRHKTERVQERLLPVMVAIAGLSLSWLIGGYYYVVYYGPLVKPIIKQGEADWAHRVVMESKEHVFLFLLPASVVLWFGMRLTDQQIDRLHLRSALKRLVAVTAGLGLSIGLAGFVISSAARWT